MHRKELSLCLIFIAALLCAANQIHGQGVPDAAATKVPETDPSIQCSLGDKVFFSNPSSARSLAEGIMHYRAAADAGYILAQRMLGGIYERGIRVPWNPSEAAHWYEMAAEQGDQDSQFALGKQYEDGRGVPKNFAVAVYWYQKAEQQGHTLAAKYRKTLTDTGVTAQAPLPAQLPPTETAYASILLQATLEQALQTNGNASPPNVVANLHQSSSSVSEALNASEKRTGRTCTTSIAFAIAQGGSVAPLVPDFAAKWAKNNQKKYPQVCFSQSPVPNAQNYVIVFSTAQDSLSGFQPVVRTSTSTSTSPVQGSGTIMSNTGSMWQYSYNGTITTTTTTTTTQDVPYSLRESTLYLTVYNSYGTMVQQRWASDSRQLGGDPYQALGHNLGMALRNIHIKERLLKAAVENLVGR